MGYERHPIEGIEGIGKTFGAELRERNFHATEDLLFGHPIAVRDRVLKVPRFPGSRFWEFRAQAELMQVSGITGQIAEGLYRSGRRGLSRFAVSNAAEVTAALARLSRGGLIPAGPPEEDVSRWQKRAVAVQYAGKVCGVVRDENAKAIAGAVLHIETEQALSDARGYFWFPVVPFGRRVLVVRATGFRRSVRKIAVLPGRLPELRVVLEAGVDSDVTIDEAAGGVIRAIAADDVFVFEDVALASIPDGTPLLYRRRMKNGVARFLSVYRTRRNNQIVVGRVTVPRETPVPENAQGRVYYWRGKTLVASADTSARLRASRVPRYAKVSSAAGPGGNS